MSRPIPRFSVPAALLSSAAVGLCGAQAHQVRRVLRLRPGDRIALFCGDGLEHEAVIISLTPDQVHLRLEATRSPEVEHRCWLEFGVARLKGDRSAWVVQKLVELGVRSIVILETERTVPVHRGGYAGRFLDRLAAIAREAVEQCGGVCLPTVAGPVQASDFFRSGVGELTAVADPSAAATLRQCIGPARARLRIAIGPEGGFSEAELSQAEACGALRFKLGDRVLRSETAAVAAAALAVDQLR
jgi:16S rRNA (uracil1498-N3)-methyltransferase